MNIIVRKLEKEDIESIIPLRIALQIYDYDGDLGIDPKLLEDRTRTFLEENLNKELFMFGTFVDEELVSLCGFIISKQFPNAGDLSGEFAYITTVYTKEEHRGQGYQRRVLEECINYAKKLGLIRFKLNTLNPKAMKIYESFGFKDDISAKKMKIKKEN